MADSKFSALPAVVTPLGTDEFAVNQGGTSKKITLTQVRAIGSAVQAWDDDLDDIAALTPTLGAVMIGDGTNWISDTTPTLVGELTTVALAATTDLANNIGTVSLRYGKIFGRSGIFVQGNGTVNPGLGLQSGVMAGVATSDGSGTGTMAMTISSAACIGRAVTRGAGNCTTEAKQIAASVFGATYTYTTGTHKLTSSGYSSFAGGYAYGLGTDTVQATGTAAFCWGYAFTLNSGNTGTVESIGKSSFCAGGVVARSTASTARMTSSGTGSFVSGYIRCNGNFTGVLEATAAGSSAGGYTKVSGANSTIQSTAKGALAWGYALDTTIAATAINAVQFGVGTNSTADSLQVGTGVLLEAAGHITSTGKRIKNTTRYTTTQTIPVTDHIVFANTDGGAYTATLPAGVEGATHKIINSGSSSNNLTIAPNGSEHLLGINSNFVLADAETLDITYSGVDGWY